VIGFLHLPKTGGTSIRKAFEVAGLTVWRPTGPRYQSHLWGKIEGFDVATGHLTFASLESTGPSEMFTVVREPVARFLSHYFVERDELGYWPDPDVVPDNIMCRLLGNAESPLVDAPDLDVAVANLDRFDHIGFTDRLSDTFARYGLTEEHERRSERGDDLVPDWLIHAATERTRLDAALYNHALELV
jgi:hypothetical protein